jgi:hypothetical protein
MAGSEGGKQGANWMRDQWVANLKKKRMTTGDSGATASVTSVGAVPVVKAGIRAESSRSASDKPRPKRTTKSKSAAAKAAAVHEAATLDKEGLVRFVTIICTDPSLFADVRFRLQSLMQSAMFFNDLGCFELESPSFMRLSPTSSSLLDVLPSPLPAKTTAKADKKWTKPLMKKRSNCFSSELHSEPTKRRTPRRPHSHSGSFDDSDASSQHSYTSVGTPSNFNSVDVARMWGPELDFANGYVDTFLDLPTPKSAEMPHVTSSATSGSGAYVSSTPTAVSLSRENTADDLEPPKLVRTSSIEQEGLSQFFEQTTLGGEPLKAETLRQHGFRTPRQAAASAVDDYFGKIVPSPAHYAYASSGRCVQSTPRGTLRPHHSTREYSFDPKKPTSTQASASEFDTLVQEYEFTDFDQELDSFYLDSIESFGKDGLDLISS